MLTFDGIDGYERSLLSCGIDEQKRRRRSGGRNDEEDEDEAAVGSGVSLGLMMRYREEEEDEDEEEMFGQEKKTEGDGSTSESDWIHPKFASGPSWADLMEKEELFQKYVSEEEKRDRGRKIFVGGFTFDSLSTDEEKEKRLEALFSCFMVFGDIVRTKVRAEQQVDTDLYSFESFF